MFKCTAPIRLMLDKQPYIIARTIKSDLKIKWIRPEKVSCVESVKTGDRAKLPDIDKTQYALAYQKSKELET